MKRLFSVFTLLFVVLLVLSGYALADGPAIQLSNNMPETNRYVGLDFDFDRHRAWSMNQIGSVEILNSAELVQAYGGFPVWTVEQTAGNEVDFLAERQSNDGVYRLDLRLNQAIEKAEDLVFTVTCSWGGAMQQTACTVHGLMSPNGLPEDLDYPTEVIVQEGKAFTVAPSVLPAGWTLPGYPASLAFNGGEMEAFAEKVAEDSTDTSAVFVPHTPGTFPALVMMEADTMMVGHRVVFRVADKDGHVPEPTLDMDLSTHNGSSTERNMYLVEDSDLNSVEAGKIQSDSYITSLGIRNAEG